MPVSVLPSGCFVSSGAVARFVYLKQHVLVGRQRFPELVPLFSPQPSIRQVATWREMYIHDIQNPSLLGDADVAANRVS